MRRDDGRSFMVGAGVGLSVVGLKLGGTKLSNAFSNISTIVVGEPVGMPGITNPENISVHVVGAEVVGGMYLSPGQHSAALVSIKVHI